MFLPILFVIQEAQSGSKRIRAKWLFPRLSQNLDENLYKGKQRSEDQQNHLLRTWQFRAKSNINQCADRLQASAFLSVGFAQDKFCCSRTRFWSRADTVRKGNFDNFGIRDGKWESWGSLSCRLCHPFLSAPLSQAVDKQRFVGKLGITAQRGHYRQQLQYLRTKSIEKTVGIRVLFATSLNNSQRYVVKQSQKTWIPNLTNFIFDFSEEAIKNTFQYQDVFNNLAIHTFSKNHRKLKSKSPDPPEYPESDLELIRENGNASA